MKTIKISLLSLLLVAAGFLIGNLQPVHAINESIFGQDVEGAEFVLLPLPSGFMYLHRDQIQSLTKDTANGDHYNLFLVGNKQIILDKVVFEALIQQIDYIKPKM